MALYRYIVEARSSHPMLWPSSLASRGMLKIMLILHPAPTWCRASPVDSTSFHDLVELHWHSKCIPQAAHGSGSVSGIILVPLYCHERVDNDIGFS